MAFDKVGQTIGELYDRNLDNGFYSIYPGKVCTVDGKPWPDPPPDPWDTQVGGEHYKLPIQPLQYALANNLGIMEHAVVKYVTRHISKGGKQDLEKARDYLDKMIAHYYGDNK